MANLIIFSLLFSLRKSCVNLECLECRNGRCYYLMQKVSNPTANAVLINSDRYYQRNRRNSVTKFKILNSFALYSVSLAKNQPVDIKL